MQQLSKATHTSEGPAALRRDPRARDVPDLHRRRSCSPLVIERIEGEEEPWDQPIARRRAGPVGGLG
jgi:hypothetical protein